MTDAISTTPGDVFPCKTGDYDGDVQRFASVFIFRRFFTGMSRDEAVVISHEKCSSTPPSRHIRRSGNFMKWPEYCTVRFNYDLTASPFPFSSSFGVYATRHVACAYICL